MGCCGKREKFGDLHNEQKWEYVVCTRGYQTPPLLTHPESGRLQRWMGFGIWLRLSTNNGCGVYLHLRRRFVRGCQSPRFQQMGWADSTRHSFQHFPVDLRRMHHPVLRTPH